jgi:hypothetical protein
MLGPDAPPSPVDVGDHSKLVLHTENLTVTTRDGVTKLTSKRAAEWQTYAGARYRFEEHFKAVYPKANEHGHVLVPPRVP